MEKIFREPYFIGGLFLSIIIIFYSIAFKYGNKYGGLLVQNKEISLKHYEKTVELKESFPEFLEGQELISSSFEDQIITYEEYNVIRDLFDCSEKKAKKDKLENLKFKLNS